MLEANSVAERNPFPWFCTLIRIPDESECGAFWRTKTSRPSTSPIFPPVHQLSLVILIVIPVWAVAGPLTPLPSAFAVTVAAEQGLLMQFKLTGPTTRGGWLFVV